MDEGPNISSADEVSNISSAEDSPRGSISARPSMASADFLPSSQEVPAAQKGPPAAQQPLFQDVFTEAWRSGAVPDNSDELLVPLNLDNMLINLETNFNALHGKIDDLSKKTDSERQAKPGCEKLVRDIGKALDEGDVGCRTALGQQFSKWLKENPERAQEYKNMKAPGSSTAQKKAFRLQWATSLLDQKTEIVKTRLQEWENVDEELGTYEPFERIVYFEGGRHSPAAVAAAIRYCCKAIAMKGKWLSVNEMTDRVDVLYVKKSFKKIFHDKWSLYQQQRMTVDTTSTSSTSGAAATAAPAGGGAEAPAGGGATPAGGVAPAAGDGAAPKGAKDKKRKGAGGGDGSPSKAAKGNAPLALMSEKQTATAIQRKAAILKQKYQGAMTTHFALTENISQEPEWAWANNPVVNTKLHEAQLQLAKVIGSDKFFAFYVTHDMAEVRKQHPNHDVNTKLTEFLRDLQPPVDALVALHAKYQKMHLANLAD